MLGDAHLYNNRRQTSFAISLTHLKPLPQMKMTILRVKDIFGFKFEDFKLVGYRPHPHIKRMWQF
jgi:thymidylate synthase